MNTAASFRKMPGGGGVMGSGALQQLQLFECLVCHTEPMAMPRRRTRG